MSLTAQLFSPADYIALAAATGVHKEILASRLAYTRSLNEFRVPEIKEIIRWLKTRTNWQANPELHRRTQTSATGTAGKKQQLIDHLKNILQAQQQVVQLQAQGQYDPNNPAFAAAAAAVAASSNLPPNSAEMQAQYRAQQQHAQQAAARFQASADPYRYNNGQQLQQQQPNRGPPPQQYSQYPYQQQPPQQQFNFTTGTMYGQQQQQQQQQQRGYPQQHMPSGYAPVTYGQPAYPGAASSIPTHLSHPALQATKQNEIQQLMAAPGMTKNLNPYELVVQQLARNMLNATSHTANQITGAAGGAYHTTLNFTISQAYLLRMKRANRPPAAGQESQQLEAHLRLFSGITLEHFHWDRKFTVRVNGHEVTIPEPKKLSKSKKKGLELVRGLDISEYVQASNTVEVTAHRASFTVELFRGLVMADLIRIRDTSELLEEFKRKIKDEESKLQATALERCCIICQSKKDPLRCSRCKNEWYCGIVHQKEHWPAHRTSCTQPTPEQDAIREAHEKKAAQEAMLGKNGRTKLIMPVKVKHEGADGLGENELEDGVEEVDTLVSLKCPLSLERYELPARGRNCAHLTCFNLETYLMFSQQSGIWQCPWCYKGLPCEEIEINLQMAAILRETDGEIAQIRVHPNGEYDPIKDRPDGESGDGREPGRKRKQPSGSPTNVPAAAGGPQKIQALGSAAGAAPDMAGSIAAAASANEANGWIPAEGGISFSAAGTVPAGASSGLDGQHAPNGNGLTTSAPEAGGPAGTADEPIELD